jgi:hypothetical protein
MDCNLLNCVNSKLGNVNSKLGNVDKYLKKEKYHFHI